MKKTLRFWKGHGLGNDYLVVDAAELPFPLQPAHARALCDRHRGPGSDGVLVADVSARPFRLQIINPDGSLAEKSGNGLRIFGSWLYARGLVGSEPFRVALAKDEVEMTILEELDAGALLIRVEMGRASFRGEDAGFTPVSGEGQGVTLELPERATALVHPVSLGNPHCVVFVDALDRQDFLQRAPALCTHPAFAAGTNVQFARPLDERRVEVWIWERGAGETLASGSSACAAAAAGVRTGRLRAGPVQVVMPGGVASIEVGEDMAVRLTAPVQLIYEGRLREEVLQGWSGTTAAPATS